MAAFMALGRARVMNFASHRNHWNASRVGFGADSYYEGLDLSNLVLFFEALVIIGRFVVRAGEPLKADDLLWARVPEWGSRSASGPELCS
jgi:hypothetical protein